MFALLYLQAYRKRRELALNPLKCSTRALAAPFVSAGVGLVAIVIALFAPMPFPMFSGFTYFMGPAHWAFGVSAGRRRKAIESRLAPAAGV